MRVQQKKAEAESQQRKEQVEARVAERRARVLQRVTAQEEKIRRAAEEREQREAAYQALLSRTRERAPSPHPHDVADLLLRPRLHAHSRITLRHAPCFVQRAHFACACQRRPMSAAHTMVDTQQSRRACSVRCSATA